jgi:integrase
MSRIAKQLSQRRIETLKRLGRHPDGGNLYLKIGKGGRRNWVFLYQRYGRRREMGLGPAGENGVGLGEARAYAEDARRLLRDGKDPIEARATKRAAEATEGKYFKSVAELYLAAHEDTWKNPKHRAQWKATLETYVYPRLGLRPLSEIDTGAVMDVLEPIWRDKTETATRVRGRIELILDYASARGWRTGENPARWRGHLDKLLPRPSKVAVVEHHAALPWQDIGPFMEALRKREAKAAQALDFLILTAARTSEVLGATWGEFDLSEGIWTIPAARMKAARAHRVPLSKPARAILGAVKPDTMNPDAYVFVSDKEDKPLSTMALLMLLRRMDRNDLTAHGFRSTFRTWAGETTAYAREVAEAALAHSIGDKTEAAYARGDLFTKRARLMEDWATFCARKRNAGDVIAMKARGKSAQ